VYPWEQKPELALIDYVKFMDTHVRVCVSIDGEIRGSFAIIDDGTNMDAEVALPNGKPLVFKIRGQPRTVDPIMTATELIHHVLTNYK
jgi:hypothetical protein